MIAGKQYEGPMADLWSCGVILFALVCGHLPFEDPNTSALYQKILSGQYKPAKWCSNEVKDLIRKILEVNPSRRYRISDIRKHVWYKAIPNDQIPRDQMSVEETEQSRIEIFNTMTEANVDLQLVKDGIASKLCNSYTAMYYLLEQKAKNALFKQKQQQFLLKGDSHTKTQTSVATTSPAVAVTTSVDTVEYSQTNASGAKTIQSKQPTATPTGPIKPIPATGRATQPHPPTRPTPVPPSSNTKSSGPLVPKLKLPPTGTESNQPQAQKFTSLTTRQPSNNSGNGGGNGSTQAIPGPNTARSAATHGITTRTIKPTHNTTTTGPTRPAPTVSKTTAGVNGMQSVITNDMAKLNINTQPQSGLVPVPVPKGVSAKSPVHNGSTSFASTNVSVTTNANANAIVVPSAQGNAPVSKVAMVLQATPTAPVAVAPSKAPVQRSSNGTVGGRKGKNLVNNDENITIPTRPTHPAPSSTTTAPKPSTTNPTASSTIGSSLTPRESAARNKMNASSNIKSIIG